MDTFKLHLKHYLKSRFLCIITAILFSVYGIGHFVHYFVFRSELATSPLYFLTVTLMAAMFLPVFFMFISYEYCYKTKQVHLDECVQSINNGRLKMWLGQFSVLVILNLILTVIILFANIFIYFDLKINSAEYLLHIIKNIFLNVFLASLVGVLLGMAAATALKRIPAYIMLIVFTLFGAGVFYPLFIGLYNDVGFNAYPVLDLFAITSPSLKWASNGYFGYSLLSYQYQRIGIWVFGALALILFSMAPRKKALLRPAAAASLAACLCCAVFFYLPASKVNMEIRHPESSTGNDYYLDKDTITREEDGGFQVTAYDLDFKINRQLKATAILTIDRPDLEAYKFTLSHSYKVKSVTDQNQTPLAFQQEGDYIDVTRGNEPIEKIIMTYAGYDNQFYANRQGVFLPGQFCYYPQSGYHKVVDSTTWVSGDISFVKHLLPEATLFHVTSNLEKKLFSNLDKQADGSLSGQADSLTLMSGMIKEIEVDGTTVFYPYADYNGDEEETIIEPIRQFFANNPEHLVYKKIFLIPNMNLGSLGQIAVFSNYINISGFHSITQLYERHFISTDKLDLYDTCIDYIYAPDTYSSRIEFWEQTLESEEERSTRAILLFDTALKSIGEEKLIAACEAYLNDGNDTRPVLEFLNDLLKEGA